MNELITAYRSRAGFSSSVPGPADDSRRAWSDDGEHHLRERPIRVMHVVHCLGANGHTGGMEYGVIKLVNAFDRSRITSAVCSTRRADCEFPGLLDSNVSYYECNGRRGNDPRLVLALVRVFRAFRPDIVHTHGWGTLIEGTVAARLAGVPRVIHGEHGTLQARRHQLLLQRFVWGRVDKVLSVSSRLAERLVREVGCSPARIHTIRNGVSLERFSSRWRQEIRGELAFDSDTIAIGSVGRLVEVKNHALLLRAFRHALSSERRLVLVLAGDGPLRGSLEMQAHDLGIESHVRFLGHRRDIEKVVSAFDVFVLSSSSEGLSNTILEAMASGVAVVSTRVGGADELVIDGETGLLVAAEDSSALAAAMRRLAEDAMLRRQMASAGLARVRREFSLEAMIGGYQELYDQTAHARQS